jgi:paraquat-inducible protein B
MTTEATQVQVRKRRGPSIVWLIPIVAALIGIGVAYRTISERGPTIELVFQDGGGLEAGKTKVKYLDVEVGLITSVDIDADLDKVVATAEMVPGAKSHLDDKAVFWLVSPHFSLSGISGLGTVVSGEYVALQPGNGKLGARRFEVATSPPPGVTHEGAMRVQLNADDLGSLGPGSPVTYRGLEAGEVERHEMLADGVHFTVHALIFKDFKHLVLEDTWFWNASGLDVTVGPGGLNVRTGSLGSILAGGIAFGTPPEGMGSAAVQEGAAFDLYESYESAHASRGRRRGLTVVVEARDGSMPHGAPVFYRKHEVGHVDTSELSPDATTVRYTIVIEHRYAALVRKNSRFWNAGGVKAHVGLSGLDLETDSLKSILEGGIEFATPDPPGAQAEKDALFALHEKPRASWLAWAPRIPLGDADEKTAVAHALKPRGSGAPSLRFVLESFSASSVKSGDAITYRELKVGQIGARRLSADGKTVRFQAVVWPRYANLVRENSRFWNTSGVDVHLGLSGLEVQTGSMESMLEGGVAFATPDQAGAPIDAGTIFPLHPKGDDEWKRWSPALQVGTSPPEEHAIHAERDHHLFGGDKVESEALDPDAGTPAVGTPPEKDEPGFFRRIFGGGDDSD